MDLSNHISLEKRPCPHIVVDNFVNDITLDYIKQEIKSLKSGFSFEGYNNKKTLRDSIDPRYCETQFIRDPRSVINYIFQGQFWHNLEDSFIEIGDYAFRHSLYTRQGPILLSAYKNHEFYGEHIDIDMDSIITAILMVRFSDEFKGGDFYLDEKKIQFKNKRLIVFPSCAPHKVGKVRLNSDEYLDQRFTLQYFVSATRPKNKLIDESNHI